MVHDEPENFDRKGVAIFRCACCHGVRPENMPEELRDRLDEIEELAQEFGNDLEEFACFLEDFL